MQYRKAGAVGVILFSALLTLTGCKDKGEAFIGNWVEITNSEHPSGIKITYDNGVYHVDHNKYYPVGLANYRIQKMEASAESDNVLLVINGFGRTMRLNDNVISFDNSEYKKQN